MRLGPRKSRSSTYYGSRRPGHAPRNLRRRHGFSAGTLNKWQWKFGGPEVSDAKPSPRSCWRNRCWIARR
jgi:hypothetical protein